MYQNAAFSDDISEIQSFLDHGDYSLAVRRLLDKSLDAGDEQMIKEAIACSKIFNSQQQKNISDDFIEKAGELLRRLSEDTAVFQSDF